MTHHTQHALMHTASIAGHRLYFRENDREFQRHPPGFRYFFLSQKKPRECDLYFRHFCVYFDRDCGFEDFQKLQIHSKTDTSPRGAALPGGG